MQFLTKEQYIQPKLSASRKLWTTAVLIDNFLLISWLDSNIGIKFQIIKLLMPRFTPNPMGSSSKTEQDQYRLFCSWAKQTKQKNWSCRLFVKRFNAEKFVKVFLGWPALNLVVLEIPYSS